MAWVRYDDQFYANAKVTAVIAEDPGALALHVLANTWTNGQKRIGHIPAHQPGFLICDRSQGQKWAEVLVRHGLWHEVSKLVDCPSCFEAYTDVEFSDGGYVIHDSHKYRAPARERTTPGTPSDLSEKRREAGRKGGKSSAAKREQTKQVAQANQANGVSKTSNLLLAGVSPEPVPGSSSNEEELPEPLFASDEAKVPPSAGTAKPRHETKPAKSPKHEKADQLTTAWWERYKSSTAQSFISVRGVIRTALGNGLDRDDVARALDQLSREGRAISGGAIQTALSQINGRQLRPTGTGGHQPYRNPDDQSVYYEDL